MVRRLTAGILIAEQPTVTYTVLNCDGTIASGITIDATVDSNSAQDVSDAQGLVEFNPACGVSHSAICLGLS